MKIYFAGCIFHNYTDYLLNLNCTQVLLSYYYWTVTKWERLKIKFPTVFVDSGAFSAWSQNISINIDKYGSFIKEYSKQILVYANLDVIENAKMTLENQERMENVGLKPIPVFHIGEDFKYLNYYCEKYNYLALGGMVGKTRREKDVFLSHAFAMIKDYWPLKVHAFALTDIELLKKYPFYSIDTTRWLSSVRFKDLRKRNLIRSDKETIIDKIIFKHSSTLERLKYPILNVLKLEKDLTNLWESRGVIWDD